ncbi:hypothetical protein DRO59_03325 [Candidatus Bathyarchaeota archaeon]|nr:MAG: hypothetical protein DRO59_03325 [Candidatus Bathyarchaeota archaeon]
MWILTRIFSSAAPHVLVESAVIVRAKECYHIYVSPNHLGYWDAFRRRYPGAVSRALKYGARIMVGPLVTLACPEFGTKEDLVSWIEDVLGLSRGERKLLRLCM